MSPFSRYQRDYATKRVETAKAYGIIVDDDDDDTDTESEGESLATTTNEVAP